MTYDPQSPALTQAFYKAMAEYIQNIRKWAPLTAFEKDDPDFDPAKESDDGRPQVLDSGFTFREYRGAIYYGLPLSIGRMWEAIDNSVSVGLPAKVASGTAEIVERMLSDSSGRATLVKPDFLDHAFLVDAALLLQNINAFTTGLRPFWNYRREENKDPSAERSPVSVNIDPNNLIALLQRGRTEGFSFPQMLQVIFQNIVLPQLIPAESSFDATVQPLAWTTPLTHALRWSPRPAKRGRSPLASKLRDIWLGSNVDGPDKKRRLDVYPQPRYISENVGSNPNHTPHIILSNSIYHAAKVTIPAAIVLPENHKTPLLWSIFNEQHKVGEEPHCQNAHHFERLAVLLFATRDHISDEDLEDANTLGLPPLDFLAEVYRKADEAKVIAAREVIGLINYVQTNLINTAISEGTFLILPSALNYILVDDGKESPLDTLADSLKTLEKAYNKPVMGISRLVGPDGISSYFQSLLFAYGNKYLPYFGNEDQKTYDPFTAGAGTFLAFDFSIQITAKEADEEEVAAPVEEQATKTETETGSEESQS